jgi:hypothetical protein
MGKGITYIGQDKDWEGSLPSEFVEGVTGTAGEITVDNTDPQNPIVSIDGSFVVGGQVDSIVGTANEILVDNGDPENPILSMSPNYEAPTNLEKYLKVVMTGLSSVNIDTATYDSIYLGSIDTNFTITLSGLVNGRTVTVFLEDSVGHVTWPVGLYWPEGEGPIHTAGVDIVVLTMVDGKILASLSANYLTL